MKKKIIITTVLTVQISNELIVFFFPPVLSHKNGENYLDNTK